MFPAAVDSKHDWKKFPVRESDETNEEELKLIWLSTKEKVQN